MSDPIAAYTFLPWLRQGIAAQIRQPDTLGPGGPAERAEVRISLNVNNQADFATNDVLLLGPGDVIGIHPQAVVRTEPRNWVTDYEPNYLAAIDFYDEDFPWRYTPASAVRVDAAGGPVTDNGQSKLRPWIFLLALDETEFTEGRPPGAPLAGITLTGDPNAVFPPADQAWAWAHVHVSRDITNAGANTPQQTVVALKSLVHANPDSALSRLVCPRKLKEDTAYHAFVIPAFEIGRLAGLALPTVGQDALAPSWGNGQTEYPVYYRWFFRTARRGDFEYLVNLLEPRRVDERVGIRGMDMQAPGFGVPGMRDAPGDSAVMGLEGALKSPQARTRPAEWPPAPHPAFLTELAARVNLQEDALQPPADGGEHPDPVISPPLYGRWHALQSHLHVDDPGWANELNRDPRLRVPAGLGTQVIQANQEDYMQKAWQQLGDVLAANQKIRQFQVSITAGARVLERFLKPLGRDQKLAVTAQVHRRVLGSPTTVARQVEKSRLPAASLDPAFRRMTRPRGALMRKAFPQQRGRPGAMLSRMNTPGGITAAPPKRAPEKEILLEGVARSLLPFPLPGWLRAVLLWKPLRAAMVTAAVLLLLFSVVTLGLGLPVTLLGLAALGVIEYLRGRLEAATRLGNQNRTVAAVQAIPPRPGFVLTEPGNRLPPGIGRSGSSDSPEAARFRQALVDVNARFESPLPVKTIGPPLDFDRAAAVVEQALNPVTAIPRRALSLIAIPPTFTYLKPTGTIVPVMAHPVLNEPMYRPLRDLSSELLIPNLHLIPNNTITLLETNPRFIEAYVVGLNHEFARELLWREYPTDLRPSSFLLFWEPAERASRDRRVDPATRARQLRDFKPLHEWGPSTDLGTHENKPLPTGSEPGESRLVLVIRGDLLKRYPSAILYAQKAKWVEDPDDPVLPRRMIRVLNESDPDVNLLEPIFKAEVLPDLRFIGFDLTASQAKGSIEPEDGDPGWFFVIQERPGEPRFGLDIHDTTPPTPTRWTDLSWNHLGDPAQIGLIDLTTVPTTNITTVADDAIQWGVNAADMAYILYQVPVMVAVHAERMLV
ncbi:hypothetical protein [Micromonospora sp. NBC_00858]|uniref:hypothetical protein n=1 Tax=Micromonospora sp. NBC_00858 TaxID=2975979 RepID=UPI00386A9305|nr:hypothetical protein OG990_15700 [Micromonospora sp. NBC_00858]